MNLASRSVFQLSKVIRRGTMAGKDAAFEWAERIERGPVRSCVPKKLQRKAGLLPPV